jgi:hypothetical protein
MRLVLMWFWVWILTIGKVLEIFLINHFLLPYHSWQNNADKFYWSWFRISVKNYSKLTLEGREKWLKCFVQTKFTWQYDHRVAVYEISIVFPKVPMNKIVKLWAKATKEMQHMLMMKLGLIWNKKLCHIW